ncbi:MAG: arylsulfatase [Planctomycetia bacterium]
MRERRTGQGREVGIMVAARAAVMAWGVVAAARSAAQDVLPFPDPPLPSVVRERLQDSKPVWPEAPRRIAADAPNIVVILLDDVGFGVAETFGGEVRTPTLSRLAETGIRYTRFHTTSICSPTRAALLTGRNHTRVGSGTIAERAVAFDGYTGVIPKTAATVAEVLRHYGYRTGAFGKWHNTPATETTAIGPKDRWPTGYGFDHFYGFLAGETSQWEPRLVRNLDAVEPPQGKRKHLTEDLVDEALGWLDDRGAYAPDKPFFLYFAPGAVHGPHHVAAEWADRYRGKFDDGWDAYRQRVHRRQLDSGVIPPGTKLTPRPDTLQAWADIPAAERPFQTRGMELFAGFVEHTDAQLGRLVDGLEARGLRDDTLIFCIWGDNGSSAEGQQGTISELLAQNNIPTTVAQQLAALDRLGGLPALGSPATDNMYHAGWAWAGSTPFRSTKLVAAHFGGTRNPLVVSWPRRIKPDGAIRTQFQHVVDVVPTIYEVVGITPPQVVNGQRQIGFDGESFAATFDDARAPERKAPQFFDNNGSRGIHKDGWFAYAIGPLYPWNTPASLPRIASWDSATDQWELYHVAEDFSQADDLAAKHPEKLAELKREFLRLAADNHDFPIGAGNWLRLHPEDRVKTPYDRWTFTRHTRRMPEFAAPGLGRESTVVELDVTTAPRSSGVLYALGGSGGGLALSMEEGHLSYLYNMMIVERYTGRSPEPLPPGKHAIRVTTSIPGPGQPGTVSVDVDGRPSFTVALARTVPAAFTASESFDVGLDLGSTVDPAWLEREAFAFDGAIGTVRVTRGSPQKDGDGKAGSRASR